MAKIESEYRENPYVQINTNQSLTDVQKQSRFEEQLTKDKTRIFFEQLLWFSCLGIPLAFSCHWRSGCWPELAGC